MTLRKDDYVFYYWKGTNSGFRLVKITSTSTEYVIGNPLITTEPTHDLVHTPFNNPYIEHLQHIPSDELHLYPHLFI